MMYFWNFDTPLKEPHLVALGHILFIVFIISLEMQLARPTYSILTYYLANKKIAWALKHNHPDLCK